MIYVFPSEPVSGFSNGMVPPPVALASLAPPRITIPYRPPVPITLGRLLFAFSEGISKVESGLNLLQLPFSQPGVPEISDGLAEIYRARELLAGMSR